ncbi:MAG: hypothetical protein U5O16_29935 [Rhodococcus sp. (in: high G+C Gram-positive bacteria)]|uniref:hypothetical protein n=1 Tax=Rhodococcus sp. TaxID=1831 RepID=UPI002AD7400B|nr:hypothetical protein [Rhodococcus sp. (in: high G+C Gram-positive bacteria)]
MAGVPRGAEELGAGGGARARGPDRTTLAAGRAAAGRSSRERKAGDVRRAVGCRAGGDPAQGQPGALPLR